MLLDIVLFVKPGVGSAESDAWPLYGPQAGGTLVTVTGSDLIGLSAPEIVFISSNLHQVINLSTVAHTEQYTSNGYIGIFFLRECAMYCCIRVLI